LPFGAGLPLAIMELEPSLGPCDPGLRQAGRVMTVTKVHIGMAQLGSKGEGAADGYTDEGERMCVSLPCNEFAVNHWSSCQRTWVPAMRSAARPAPVPVAACAPPHAALPPPQRRLPGPEPAAEASGSARQSGE